MDQVFPCPHCRRQLTIGDHLAGKKIACPKCKGIFVAPKLEIPEAIAVEDLPEPIPADEEPEEESELDFLNTATISAPSAASHLATPKKAKPESTKALVGCGVVLAFGVVLVVICAGVMNAPDRRTEKEKMADRTESEGTMAFIQSKDFVTKRLKSPSTAEFPMLDFSAESLGGGRYRVKSYVDAQNSFGAKMRTNYTCILRVSGDSWTLESLDLDE